MSSRELVDDRNQLTWTMVKIVQPRLAVVFALLALLIALAFVFFASEGQVRVTSSESPPDRFVYLREGSDLTVADSSGQQTVIAELEDTALIPAGSTIESVEPAGRGEVFVGFCCMPEGGRQLIVNLDSSRIEFLPLTVRFPSASAEGNILISGGDSVRVEDLGSLLAYESGVGVVAPGPTLREAVNNELLRPVSLPMDRAAFVSNEVLTVTNFAGEVLVEREAADVSIVDYDSRNDVLVALDAPNSVRLLTPDTLEVVTEWTLDQETTSIDVVDGWLLVSTIAQSIEAIRIDGSASQVLIESGGGAAGWLPPV